MLKENLYHFFTHLFEEIDVQECDLDEEIMERFLLKMVHMLGIYYADYSRKSTLGSLTRYGNIQLQK